MVLIVAVNAVDIYLPFRDQRGQLSLKIVSIASCSSMAGIQTDVDVGFVPFEDGRESSILGCISTKDLLDRIDASLLGKDDSGGPNQGSVCSDETRHLLPMASLERGLRNKSGDWRTSVDDTHRFPSSKVS